MHLVYFVAPCFLLNYGNKLKCKWVYCTNRWIKIVRAFAAFVMLKMDSFAFVLWSSSIHGWRGVSRPLCRESIRGSNDNITGCLHYICIYNVHDHEKRKETISCFGTCLGFIPLERVLEPYLFRKCPLSVFGNLRCRIFVLFTRWIFINSTCEQRAVPLWCKGWMVPVLPPPSDDVFDVSMFWPRFSLSFSDNNLQSCYRGKLGKFSVDWLRQWWHILRSVKPFVTCALVSLFSVS